MPPFNNIPCNHLTPRMLIDLANYEWALPVLERNVDRLPIRAWRILESRPWATSFLMKHCPT